MGNIKPITITLIVLGILSLAGCGEEQPIKGIDTPVYTEKFAIKILDVAYEQFPLLQWPSLNLEERSFLKVEVLIKDRATGVKIDDSSKPSFSEATVELMPVIWDSAGNSYPIELSVIVSNPPYYHKHTCWLFNVPRGKHKLTLRLAGVSPIDLSSLMN